MLDKGKIDSIQLMLILLMAEIATSLFKVPSEVIMAAGPDSWLSILVFSSLYGFIVAWVALTLSQRFPAQVFTEYLPDIIGLYPGKILAGIFALALISITGLALAQGTAFIHIAFLRETPTLLLDIILIGAAFYGAYLGIEVIARHNLLLFAFLSAATLAVVLLVMPDINTNNFLPVLENGWLPVLKGAKDAALWRGEVFMIIMFYPYLNRKDEASKAVYGKVILAVIYSAIITMSIIGVFGIDVASSQIYPVYRLARYISIGQIIERIDILIVIIWVSGVIIKLAIGLHAAGIAVATTIGANNYRWPLLVAAAMSTAMASLSYGTQAKLDDFLSNSWPSYAFLLELVLPVIILLLAVLFKKKGVNE